MSLVSTGGLSHQKRTGQLLCTVTFQGLDLTLPKHSLSAFAFFVLFMYLRFFPPFLPLSYFFYLYVFHLSLSLCSHASSFILFS
jgi:hypothetical protein